MSWQDDTLKVVEGISKLFNDGRITAEKYNELIVKYGIYDLTDEDLVE